MTRFFVLLLSLGLSVAPAVAEETPPPGSLTERQVQAIQTIAFLQITRKVCGYTVSGETMRMMALDGKLTFDTPAEEAALSRELVAAYEKFGGPKRVLACSDALDEFGPTGTRVKGLLSAPEGKPSEAAPEE